MIVIGIDPHKQSHTAAVVQAATGEFCGERTVSARERGHEQLVAWAHKLDRERLWALEEVASPLVVYEPVEVFSVVAVEREP